MQQGFDPGIKSFFKKIINTIATGLLWLLAALTGGLYWKLGYMAGRPLWAVITFYVSLVCTLWLLIRYYRRMWKR
ncbi:MAG TPA: hypothetical protein PKC69_00060 [Chitinophagaceae bacterium]|nr:hypothetical protein [Chitinophagaceae bacterium]